MNLEKVKTKVKRLLEKHPHLRDSDERLIATIWYNEAGLVNGNVSAVDMLNLYINKKLSSPESIRRNRQKIQEEYISLRGVNYKARQKHQKKVKKELGYGRY